jgi:hypothetical protein
MSPETKADDLAGDHTREQTRDRWAWITVLARGVVPQSQQGDQEPLPLRKRRVSAVA